MTRPAPLVDQFQRRISYLRLSVTDRCDLRCSYCMPERMAFLPRKDILTLDELYDLALGFVARGITKIRLTGGEPLVRRDMIDLIRGLGRRIGVDHGQGRLEELTLTTNGTRLADFADDLRSAGVQRINVSLDTLNRDIFARLTRRDSLSQVLDGLAAAKAAGLRVKINTVALKGVNDQEIPDLIAWAHGQGFDATLIEVMPMGEVEQDRFDHYLPLSAVQQDLANRWTLQASVYQTGGPARYWDVIGSTGASSGGRLGLITPLTNTFCDGCNRVRVTATGQLYACLGGAEKVDLRDALRAQDSGEALFEALDLAMRIKPERHHFAIETPGAAPALSRHMSTTGG